MSNAMMVLGMVELIDPKTKTKIALKATGFDVMGFLFPFARVLFGGQGKLALLYVFTFWAFPIWAWYVGFEYRQKRVEHYLNKGWVFVDDDKTSKAA